MTRPRCFVLPAIGYVLIGNGLYDEAIKHFSLILQVCLMHIFNRRNLLFSGHLLDMFLSSIKGDPELVSAIYGRAIAYGKKSLQVRESCRPLCRPSVFPLLHFCRSKVKMDNVTTNSGRPFLSQKVV